MVFSTFDGREDGKYNAMIGIHVPQIFEIVSHKYYCVQYMIHIIQTYFLIASMTF